MIQHLVQSLRSHAGPVCAAVGLALMISASPVSAQDVSKDNPQGGATMMGPHTSGIMDGHSGQSMMGNSNSHDMMMDGDHRAMGSDGHMMGSGSSPMTNGDRDMQRGDGR